MTALARTTDPITSHEAAAGVDLIRSQMLTLTFAKQYLGETFTHKHLTKTYARIHESVGFPMVSEPRLRTAVNELKRAGLIEHVGYTQPSSGRRECLWKVVS